MCSTASPLPVLDFLYPPCHASTAPTVSPTRVPTLAPTSPTSQPTFAPTVTPAFPLCIWQSPLAHTFLRQATTVQVSDSAGLRSALAAAIGKPTIIELTAAGAYNLDKAYSVASNLCIQVRW